ncbi:hypothetical protein LSPH24S_10041 [Lysinibacillus sphaericus]
MVSKLRIRINACGSFIKKQLGDKVTIQFLRDKKEQQETIALKEIPQAEEKRAGLGITYAESKSIETNPNVTMRT